MYPEPSRGPVHENPGPEAWSIYAAQQRGQHHGQEDQYASSLHAEHRPRHARPHDEVEQYTEPGDAGDYQPVDMGQEYAQYDNTEQYDVSQSFALAPVPSSPEQPAAP